MKKLGESFSANWMRVVDPKVNVPMERGLTVDQLRQRVIDMTERSRLNTVSALKLLQQAEQLNNRAELLLEIAAVTQRGAAK